MVNNSQNDIGDLEIRVDFIKQNVNKPSQSSYNLYSLNFNQFGWINKPYKFLDFKFSSYKHRQKYKLEVYKKQEIQQYCRIIQLWMIF